MTHRPPPDVSMTLCGAAPSDWRWGATDAAAAAEVVAAAKAAAVGSEVPTG
jgi:hypothetical protein